MATYSVHLLLRHVASAQPAVYQSSSCTALEDTLNCQPLRKSLPHMYDFNPMHFRYLQCVQCLRNLSMLMLVVFCIQEVNRVKICKQQKPTFLCMFNPTARLKIILLME